LIYYIMSSIGDETIHCHKLNIWREIRDINSIIHTPNSVESPQIEIQNKLNNIALILKVLLIDLKDKSMNAVNKMHSVGNLSQYSYGEIDTMILTLDHTNCSLKYINYTAEYQCHKPVIDQGLKREHTINVYENFGDFLLFKDSNPNPMLQFYQKFITTEKRNQVFLILKNDTLFIKNTIDHIPNENITFFEIAKYHYEIRTTNEGDICDHQFTLLPIKPRFRTPHTTLQTRKRSHQTNHKRKIKRNTRAHNIHKTKRSSGEKRIFAVRNINSFAYKQKQTKAKTK